MDRAIGACDGLDANHPLVLSELQNQVETGSGESPRLHSALVMALTV